jgi:hypothetical protein
MAMPKALSNLTTIAVHFCDRHNPWQSGFNEYRWRSTAISCSSIARNIPHALIET